MRKILLAACAVLAMAGAARAEEPKLYAATAGDWKIFSYQDRCSTGDFFKNGTFLQFGIDAAGRAWIRIANPEWKIPAGNYQVPVSVDNGTASNWSFEADDDGQGIVANYTMDSAIFSVFTKGAALRLRIGSKVYGYSLNGTSAMLPKLLECIGQVAKAQNPFGTPQAAPVSTPANPFKRL